MQSNSQPNPDSARSRNSYWPLIAAVAMLLLILTGATFAILVASYRDTLRQETTNLQNVATAFAAHTFTAMKAVDAILTRIQREHAEGTLNSRPEMLLKSAMDPASLEDFFIGAYLFQENGSLVAQSLEPRNILNVPGRRKPPGYPSIASPTTLNVELTDVNPETGNATVNFSRQLLNDQNHKNGAVLIQTTTAFFQNIYNSVELGKGGSVTLMSHKGVMLVRGPTLLNSIGQSFFHTPLFQRYLPAAKRGVMEAKSPVDGVDRIYGYASVEPFPLVVIVGRDKSVALAFWHERMRAAMFFLILISVTTIFLTWRVVRDNRRQNTLISKLEASEQRLAKSANYFKSILNTLATPVWVVDECRKIVLLNKSFSEFLGRSNEDLTGKLEDEALISSLKVNREGAFADATSQRSEDVVETEIQDGTGTARTVIHATTKLDNETGHTQLVNVLTDITEWKRAEMRVAYMVDFDLVTALPNQSQFHRVVSEQMSATVAGNGFGIIVISLERVQEIIDLAGHAGCDEAMRHAADILRFFTPSATCIARIKSNEFALVVPYNGVNLYIEKFATKLHDSLSGPVLIGPQEFYYGPVIGIALYPQDGRDADELLRLADIAKHNARTVGTEPIHFVSESAHSALLEHLNIEANLRRALAQNELRIVYQPKISITTGQIVGFEALLRWTNSTLGEVSPARFIPIAENTGLIVPIGTWVLEQVCHQIRLWTDELGLPVKIAVNLSLRQFHQKDLLSVIKRCIETSGADPGSLELEITESTAMSYAEEVEMVLHQIRGLGVSLSIDDFGTGYSSLAYLKRFPVQALKIDRAFVRDLGTDSDSEAIIQSILSLAHGLKLRVIAEGVETKTQLDFLRRLSCDEYQGFLFSKPVEAVAVLGFYSRAKNENRQ